MVIKAKQRRRCSRRVAAEAGKAKAPLNIYKFQTWIQGQECAKGESRSPDGDGVGSQEVLGLAVDPERHRHRVLGDGVPHTGASYGWYLLIYVLCLF